MDTVKSVFALVSILLEKKAVKNPKKEAEEILSHLFGVKKLDIYLFWEEPFLQKEKALFFAEKRGEGVPLGYLLGEMEFYSLSCKIGKEALIPRQETELLVDFAIKRWKEKLSAKKTLWDLFCGTGVIGLSFKKRFPNLSVVLSDKSENALSLARENAKRNHLSVSFKKGDFLEGFETGEKVDFFLANPPYISEKEYPFLEKEVKDYEPKEALVSGETGLEFYERIAKELPPFLEKGAGLGLEIGESQGKAVFQIFSDPFWKRKEILSDWSGKDRFFFLEIE